MAQTTNKQTEWTPIETQIAMALRTVHPERTQNCPEPDEMLRLIDTGEGTLPDGSPLMAHFAECTSCRREYVQLRADLLEADQLHAALSDAIPTDSGAETDRVNPTEDADAPLAARWRAWLQGLWTPPARLAFGVGLSALVLYAVVRPQQQNADLRRQLSRLQREAQTATANGNEWERRAAQLEQERQQDKVQHETQQTNLRTRIAALEGQIKRLPQPPPQNGEGTITGAQWAALAREVQADPQSVASLTTPPKALMGSTDTKKPVRLLSPVATYIREHQPVFRWQVVPGAAQYAITLIDANNKVIDHQSITGATEWQPKRALTPGAMYTWGVEAARQDTGEVIASSSAQFRVLETVKADRFAQISKLHLHLGELYEKAGLLEAAEQEYQAVSPTHPKYKHAQDRLRALRRRGQPKP